MLLGPSCLCLKSSKLVLDRLVRFITDRARVFGVALDEDFVGFKQLLGGMQDYVH